MALRSGSGLKQFTVISIDDHSLFRTGIELIVKGAFSQVQFASFASLGQALEAQAQAPDVVLLDLHLEGVGGHDAIPLLKLRWPTSAIILVTSEQDQAQVDRALRQGGDAAVLKSEAPERFISAIRAAAPAASANPSTHVGETLALSRRQLEVLRLLQEGLSNKAIARRLEISEFTVRGHVQQILKALEVSSRAQAVFAAQKAGIL